MPKSLTKLFVASLLALSFVPAAFAQMTLHSKIETKAVQEKKQTAITFTVVPDKDLVINMEGPWSVTVNQGDKELTKLGVEKFSQKIPGFAAYLPVGKGVDLTYKMVVFVCTSDKKTCYRDVHNGKLKT